MYDDTASYEIRLERRLGPALAARFPEFALTEEDGITVLYGELRDQAALHGVLARIRDLGLTLVACIRVERSVQSAACNT
jgi:hypothetical protein